LEKLAEELAQTRAEDEYTRALASRETAAVVKGACESRVCR
jgi:hypothetical protein